jgi:CheY-like chemotaxis protein
MHPAPAPDTLLRLDGLVVLVVDDMPQIGEMIVATLGRQGARGVPVASAAAALDALARERPDVLLADVSMPGEDGYALIRKIRALPPERGGDIPAAAFTAYDTDVDVAELLAAGFDMHLAKPASLRSLIQVVSVLRRLRGHGIQEIAC